MESALITNELKEIFDNNEELLELFSSMTKKQFEFCEYYIQKNNATEAVKLAGYKQKYANRIATQNLNHEKLKRYIELRMKKIYVKQSGEIVKLIADTDELNQYFTRVMRGEEKDQFGLECSISDRTKAAELLGKVYKMFTDKIEHSGEIKMPVIKIGK